MGYDALIGRSLTLAFKAAKDLAEDVTILIRNDNDYDFSDPSTQAVNVTELSVKLIDLGDKQTKDDSSKPSKRVMLYSSEISDVGSADTIVWGAEQWVIRNILTSARKVVSAQIERIS